MSNQNVAELSRQILQLIFRERKLVESEVSQADEIHEYLSEDELYPHLDKIERMVAKGEPITMVLPAYPRKSPNRNKTLSKYPDLAEKHSIDMLHVLCDRIEKIYSPGVKVLICSDGYVFSDLVRIPDTDVHSYTEAIKEYYSSNYPTQFDFYDIKDAFPEIKCLDAMREELMIRYGESLVSLTNRSQSEKETRSMYQGITKFLFEDFLGLVEFAGVSKTQVQKAAKSTALRVILRSNAWSKLLEVRYPEALRLSIHPQFRISQKIGIKLANSADCWRTPWHSVAVLKKDQIHLAHRNMVSESSHRLMFSQGAPSHYVMSWENGAAAHV
ncbi:L-tyrosine/L-tryptophan isonitrile synthase family protein [Pseudoalteromonas sp. DY56-GL79]|uniref:L-tyrosine/L-tryptophan isonitrile synthase family protein n=1 Tax=Pseudoalteromonas sp. DY56-GL79 TaxID=2967131 RepID=UPI00352B9A2B